MNLHVDSEIGLLRQAILHRPDLELKRLTPTNKNEYLFDDVLWVKRAKQEHDGFAESLRDLGVQVHLLDQLLTETLAIPEAKKYVLERSLDELVYGPMALDALFAVFTAMDDQTLTRYLIGGMTKRELLSYVDEPSSVVVHALGLDELLLAPLPNHLFTRDTSAWIYGGVSVNSMRKRARMRETIHYEAIYRWHPLFAGAGFDVWSEGSVNGAATAEGGDMLVLGRGAVLVGMSERTTPQGVERLAQRLFAANAAQRIVALSMPKRRAFMHLDTVMTMVDEDTYKKYAGLGMLPSYTIEPGDTGKELKVTAHAPRTCMPRSPAPWGSTPSTSSPPPRT
jgi:arginine deiminase